MANELTKAMGGHARLVSLAGVGHNDMLSSGERLWDVVKDFLNSPERRLDDDQQRYLCEVVEVDRRLPVYATTGMSGCAGHG